MSTSIPSLPQEIVDGIIDLLHHDQKALKNCCLISKRWVPQTQKHLFKNKNITFKSVQDAVVWSEIFPDPTKPPASYTRSLSLFCARSIANEDSSRIPDLVELKVSDCRDSTHHGRLNSCYARPFGNLLPNVKSLEMHWDRCPMAQEIFFFLSTPH